MVFFSRSLIFTHTVKIAETITAKQLLSMSCLHHRLRSTRVVQCAVVGVPYARIKVRTFFCMFPGIDCVIIALLPLLNAWCTSCHRHILTDNDPHVFS